jgi:hypothetical protein
MTALLGGLSQISPAADEGVEIKPYKPRVGDRVRVTDEDRSTTRSIINFPNKTENKIEKHVKVVIHTSETLEVKAGEKKATKIKRVYDKAEETKDGETTKLPLHGKAVIIEKKGERYTFTDEDGKALDGKPREELDKEFNKKDDDDLEDFIPKRALKPGETWKMDSEKLIKSFNKDKKVFEIDPKGTKAGGKFLESYDFGGHKYGVYSMEIEFPITELTGANPTPVKPGSKIAMHIIGDGNVDGGEPDGVMTMRLSMRLFIETPNGVTGSIKSDGVLTRSTERLSAAKRD